MWLLTGLGAWLVLGLPLWVALLLGAMLAPTDPVVASTLVTCRLAEADLPRWLRQRHHRGRPGVQRSAHCARRRSGLRRHVVACDRSLQPPDGRRQREVGDGAAKK